MLTFVLPVCLKRNAGRLKEVGSGLTKCGGNVSLEGSGIQLHTQRVGHAELSSVGFALALSVALGNMYLPTRSSSVEWSEALILSVFLLSSSPTSSSPSSPSNT